MPSLRISGSLVMSPAAFLPLPSSLSRKPVILSSFVCGSLSIGDAGPKRSYHRLALPRKSRTPPPPKRPVQAPKVRTAPRGGRSNRTVLIALGASALVVLAAVLAFVLLSGGDESNAATGADEKLRSGGCKVETIPAAPNFMLNGKKLPYRHLPTGTLPN